MRIALTCSIKPGDIEEKDRERYAEFDSKETINSLAEAIRANGHNVSIIDVKGDIKGFLEEGSVGFGCFECFYNNILMDFLKGL